MSDNNMTDHEKRIALIEQSHLQNAATMLSVSGKLDQILAQINRIAILEEKHSTQQLDVTRAHSRVAKVEDSLDALSVETREFMNYSKGRDKVLWAIGGVVAGLFVKVVFFAANHGMTP